MASTTFQLDPADFELSDYGPVRISLPSIPAVTEEDIEAQLFSFVVASAHKGSSIKSLADLDDAWVRDHFEGMSTMEDLKASIKQDLEKTSRMGLENYKLQCCNDALIARLEGEVPEAVVTEAMETSRSMYDDRLRASGMTKVQYLRQEKLTEEEYEQKIRADVAYNLSLNVVLDKLIERQGLAVAKEDLTEYLSADNPEAFLAEIERNGKVDEACQAAARVKAMRQIVDTAIVDEG